ncbi:TetR/AcrR family transcriptional regulator [Fructilactobacillus fructivorans]|uniref:TetR family transcriptional regulator n=1 Tax=Fructilactobacillus fructivorans TaxID=1614 RepID=A0AAE6TX09_9LACO|nr:TetR-like C-terminal domain-containing protein [Fructilactobacillus fructivorans]KRK56908.1 TetR family transcriptional regulator [Fructilactobacillus fructivorans]KRN13187.1 TetR family transcriptional regulator [Fructilactobacillus fructivorans]KRN41228.1 TetR family transcriptional regulator [Fructilactobacillus fructivorans]KRN43043.1 TetR family transcriptional regulator [Fructilactobacillus fructivorans]QFX93239.1 TetR family transcriptional regulator [Fructilactobacillus fructivorans
MEKKVDRRIRKTQGAIQTSFKELLQVGTSLDDLSVKMICDKADITRKAFYDHYADKSELVLDFMDSYFDELKLTCRDINDTKIQAKIELWIDFFTKNQIFFNNLLKSQNSYQFRKEFHVFTKEQLAFVIKDISQTELDFICYGIDGIIEKIILSEQPIDKAELASSVKEILKPYLIQNI